MPKPGQPSQRHSPPPSDGVSPAQGASAPSLGLRLVGEATGRPLTKAQKKFDRLLRKVESLRAERERATGRWDRFLKIYRERIHPEEKRMIERRRQVARLLAAHWRAPKGLGARQRDQLEELLLVQLRELRASGPDALDAELAKLWEELRPAQADEGEPNDAEASTEASSDAQSQDDAARGGPKLPREILDLIEDMGLDAKCFKAGMSPQDVMREVQRQIAEGFGEGEGAEGAPGTAGRSAPRAKSARAEAAERKAAERSALREEARKRTVVSIYKQLAKVLHPDLEQDPLMRERKHTLMQDLTKAYREGDLHTLLRLELEWINREEGDLARLGDEKLGIYAELLEEQVGELQAEIREVPHAPRFAMVVRFMNPFRGEPDDVEQIVAGIRATSDSLKWFRDALSGPSARENLRATLREIGLRQRARRAREAAFDMDFDSGF